MREAAIARLGAIGDLNRDTRLAWSLAMLSRAREIPPLEKLLIRGRQTVREQRGELHRIAAAYGLSIRRVRMIWTKVA